TGVAASFTALNASCSACGFSPQPSRMMRTQGTLCGVAEWLITNSMWYRRPVELAVPATANRQQKTHPAAFANSRTNPPGTGCCQNTVAEAPQPLTDRRQHVLRLHRGLQLTRLGPLHLPASRRVLPDHHRPARGRVQVGEVQPVRLAHLAVHVRQQRVLQP